MKFFFIFYSDFNSNFKFQAFGVFGFPFGFTTIIVCGGELFTSMCAYTAAAWWERKITLKDAIRWGCPGESSKLLQCRGCWSEP